MTTRFLLMLALFGVALLADFTSNYVMATKDSQIILTSQIIERGSTRPEHAAGLIFPFSHASSLIMVSQDGAIIPVRLRH
ncbi:MAG: hypothetical protein GPOALKHO_001939 [Sodalis sp.]|uniref:hypothetical protein n=1 Tax=Sodalis sp. (in: enterobacteria) TaxID=1898979 RepID=UPI00387345D4|nr:MAG: hypothetical protein GPOALKHO_001939 [Sodalis sp.]